MSMQSSLYLNSHISCTLKKRVPKLHTQSLCGLCGEEAFFMLSSYYLMVILENCNGPLLDLRLTCHIYLTVEVSAIGSISMVNGVKSPNICARGFMETSCSLFN